MPIENDKLFRLGAAVADADQVDWDAEVESSSDDREREIVRQLRVVRSIAEVHRSAESHEASGHPDEGRRRAAEDVMQPTMTSAPAGPEEPPTLESTPRQWGSLELQEKIGEGAFGEVFRARDPGLDRLVALKLQRASAATSGSRASKIIAEGRLLARVRHPNVVTVHGAERHEGRVGLWMELLEGRTLSALVREQGPFGAREAGGIGLDLCRALAAVHAAGLVHRDVKAQNVMREAGGRILLMDFGAGKELHEDQPAGGMALSGTPLYMAPELFSGAEASRRSDIYALGVLMFFLVTASYPVTGKSLRAIRTAHRSGERRRLRDVRADLPEGFVRVIEKAIDANPDERFATAGEMEAALQTAIGIGAPSDSRPPRRRWPVWTAVAAAMLILGSVLVWQLLAPAAAVPYSVQASFWRSGAGAAEQLLPGARIRPGDLLYLDVEASRDLHLYVLNQDQRGDVYWLFPLPDLDLGNPLAGGATHRLPGSIEGSGVEWQVTSAGGRERFVIVASLEPIQEFEQAMLDLPKPERGRPVIAAAVDQETTGRLRAVGGLAPSQGGAHVESTGQLFGLAAKLAAGREDARGVWIRQIDLENPAE